MKLTLLVMLTPSLQQLIGSCSKEKRNLGSLKILDLSFCGQLHKLGGFYELPALERLIARNCICLIQIGELLEECVELVHIDLSCCVKLEKLPSSIRKLKKVESLLLDGCNISSIKENIPTDLKFCVVLLPSSLVELSLVNNNLSSESFPEDLSCLSSLKKLWLDENPIVYMPDCVRSLCRLEELSMVDCKSLTSIEHPPCTLRRLQVWMYNENPRSNRYDQTRLERISFHPDMSPIRITENSFRPWSYEIEGMVKIQPMKDVEEKLLCSLGWSNLLYRGVEQSQIQMEQQMYYEFGIFSTFYAGQAMMPADWISCGISSSQKNWMEKSFTIPSFPNKQVRGLNIYCVDVVREKWIEKHPYYRLPVIRIINETKKRAWTYMHCVNEGFNIGGEGLTYLSHWMFGMNEMEAGDEIIITIIRDEQRYQFTDDKCGVGFVYEDEGRMEDEDALKYYKSWNYIIGAADLSSFQLTFGEYFLYHYAFTQRTDNLLKTSIYRSQKYKERRVPFTAFSKRKTKFHLQPN